MSVQADAITNALRDAQAQADYATRADLVALELRIVKWIVGTGIGVVAANVAILRLLGA